MNEYAVIFVDEFSKEHTVYTFALDKPHARQLVTNEYYHMIVYIKEIRKEDGNGQKAL